VLFRSLTEESVRTVARACPAWKADAPAAVCVSPGPNPCETLIAVTSPLAVRPESFPPGDQRTRLNREMVKGCGFGLVIWNVWLSRPSYRVFPADTVRV